MLKRTLLALPVAALMAVSVMGNCYAADNTLKIGTNPTFAPFEFQGKGSNEMVGFDLDLIQAIAKQMGRKVEVLNLGFDALIPAILTGNIDAAISGMSITDARKKAVDFTEPYYTSGLIILVDKDNDKIKSIKDLEGKRIGTQIGTTGDEKARSVKGAKVVAFNNANEPFLELNNKGIDAVIQDQPVVAYYLVTGGKGKMVGDRMEAEDYGIAVKKGNKELVKQFNDALAKLKENGEYQKIYKKWFGE